MPEIKITDKAAAEIKRVMEEQQFPLEEYVLEVGVAGGGCSGFSYKLGFKKESEVNKSAQTEFTFGGVRTSVGNRAMLYLDGTTIDFHDGLDKRGFIFTNPNATGKCGCGSSFSV